MTSCTAGQYEHAWLLRTHMPPCARESIAIVAHLSWGSVVTAVILAIILAIILATALALDAAVLAAMVIELCRLRKTVGQAMGVFDIAHRMHQIH